MEINNSRTALQKQFWFRIIVLLLSITGTAIFSAFDILCNENIEGFIVGAFASAFVWALVETVDFFTETYSIYCKERLECFSIFQKRIIEMKNVIKSTYNDIDWKTFKEIEETLYDEICNYISKSKVYVFSREFQKLRKYITRMFWVLFANYVLRDGFDKNNKAYSDVNARLKNIFISKSTTNDNLNDLVSNNPINAFNSAIDEMAQLELSFKPYTPPKEVFIEDVSGDIKDEIDLLNGEHTKYTFIPRTMLLNLHKEKQSGALKTIILLILRNYYKIEEEVEEV